MREPDTERTYIAIDLKSFYASVECVDRNLDPLTTHLVVADASRTEKTICLAVSPSLKEYGIPGRARLFEVVQRVRDVNRERKRRIRQAPFSGASSSAPALAEDPTLQADFITAVPRMAFYIEWSTRIYEIYLRYIAPEDIHVYSIDEVLMDVTRYLSLYGKSARELAMEMIRAVLQETGITATAGIGTNLYLAKIAMDIEAKHTAPDADGVRIAELDEISYRKNLWSHRPITDFWRVGRGTARKLAPYGIYTMGDVARCSLENEDLLYDLFGVNAELLIDHAWGWEPCTIELIKAYRPQSRSLSAGQVLPCPYDMEKARIVVREMAETAALDLFEKRLLTDQLTLTVCYDIENLSRPEIRQKYRGPVATDRYGRKTPKHAHGTVNLDRKTSSSGRIAEAVLSLYDRITDPALLIRRIYLNTNHVTEEGISGSQKQEKDPASAASFFTAASSAAASSAASAAAGRQERDPESMEPAEGVWEQMDLFTDYEAEERQKERDRAALEKERRLQEAMLSIRKKYGKNAILKGTNLQEGATLRQRNESIGGHRA